MSKPNMQATTAEVPTVRAARTFLLLLNIAYNRNSSVTEMIYHHWERDKFGLNSSLTVSH